MQLVTALLGCAERVSAHVPKRLLKFLSVGVVGLATHTGVFTLFYRLGVAKSPAWFVALIAATAVTWSLNRKLTFTASGRRRASEMLRYGLVTVVAQGISYAVFKEVCAAAPKFPPSLALIVGAVVATAFSYSGQRFFTFSAPKTPAQIDAPIEAPVA